MSSELPHDTNVVGRASPGSPRPTQPSRPLSRPTPPTELLFYGILNDEDLKSEYESFLEEDAGVRREALVAAWEMAQTPIDQYDKVATIEPLEDEPKGKVGRRGVPNPLHARWLGNYRLGERNEKASDPALQDNPLYGRLITLIFTTTTLLFVFLQSLVLNYILTGRFHAPFSVNRMVGPTPDVLNNLGGLNTNLIRDGQHVRLFWSMWMHSGWIHILLNALSQLQFLYMVEPDWGFMRTFVCFWISGISGNLLSSVIDPCSVTVGSSGAMYGLMGAVLVFCIEYWSTIPRPWCILFFTILVVLVSFLTGFTGNTDNWAHLGGLLGGLLFSSLTITSLTACDSCINCCNPSPKAGEEVSGKLVGTDGRAKKKVVKRGKMAHFGKGLKPTCKCGLREWILRTLSFVFLFTGWFTCFWALYKDYEYQPAGHITFSGKTACCCCYDGDTGVRANWECRQCASSYSTVTWQDFCDGQTQTRRLLQDTERQLARLLVDHPEVMGFDRASSSVPRRQLAAEFKDGGVEAPGWWMSPVEPSKCNRDEVRTVQALLRGTAATLGQTGDGLRKMPPMEQEEQEEVRFWNATQQNEAFTSLLSDWVKAKASLDHSMSSGGIDTIVIRMDYDSLAPLLQSHFPDEYLDAFWINPSTRTIPIPIDKAQQPKQVVVRV